MNKNFSCDCCKASFTCFESGGETQADGCASNVRLQRDLGPDYFPMLDCPPDNTKIAAGHYYIQSFYGSNYDSTYFAFSNAKDAQDTLSKFPWINKSGRTEVCDQCIASFLRNKLIRFVYSSDGNETYPCFCNMCDTLYENQGNGKNECNTKIHRLPTGESGFYKVWNDMFRFLNCAKKFETDERVCDSCCAFLEMTYGHPVRVRDDEKWEKPLFDEEDEEQ